MRPGDAPVTVGGVARQSLTAHVPAGPGPAAAGERRWLAAVVLVAATGYVMVAPTTGPYPHVLPPVRLVLAIVACAPLVALRRWPLPLVAFAATVTGLVIATGGTALPFGVMLGLTVYLVASRLPRRLSIPVTVSAAVIIGAG